MLAIIVNDPSAFQSMSTAFPSILPLIQHYKIPYECLNWIEFGLKDFNRYFGLLILNDIYPSPNRLAPEQSKLLEKWRQTQKPCFIEFTITNCTITPKITQNPYWRMITNDIKSPFLMDLTRFSLFEVHHSFLLESDIPINGQSLAVLGRVIGTHNAEQGLPSNTKPVLILQENMLWSAIKISDFDRMEFRPKQRWAILWRNILQFLLNNNSSLGINLNEILLPPKWTAQTFQERIAAFRRNESDADRINRYKHTVRRGFEWIIKSGILNEEGEKGVFEGFKSQFDENGQMCLFRNYYINKKYSQRADCTVDTAFALYLASLLPEDESTGWTKENLNQCRIISDRIFAHSNKEWQFFDESICRGLFSWFNDPYDKFVFYADDNGRCAFSYHLYALLSKKPEFIQRSLASTIALARTHGKNGHRFSRLELHHFYDHKGRKYFQKHKTRPNQYQSPHYEANTYSALLYGGWMTQNNAIIQKITQGIADYSKKMHTMRVEQSSNDDLSKLLIACSFLIGVETPASKLRNFDADAFLCELLSLFKRIQEPNGAVPERDLNQTRSCKEKTNASYGTIEASVYRSNQETITDQLYSTSFLLWGLYFAWKVGKKSEARDMCLKLADYLCAIQIQSANPQTNGAWMRAFDYTLGEYYGSNGDTGWGAWSIESGWMVTVILSGLLFIIHDLDPLALIDADMRKQIDTLYVEEVRTQDSIDIHWRENTPPAPKHLKVDNSFQNVVI